MTFGIVISFVMIMFIVNYMTALKYLKGLRGEIPSKFKQRHIIALCSVFGGPVLLITYMFFEIRLEDAKHHYSYIICGVLFTILQITLIVLLVYYGVIPLEPSNPETPEATLRLFNL